VLVSTPAISLDGREFRPPGREVRRVVMVGRLAPWKGQDLFLRSFAEAFRATDAEAVIVGGALFGEDEYEQHLHQEVSRLGISNRVHFSGHVEDVWSYLVDADILVHASRTPEPFGLVVVQGLWARCAVVATVPGGPSEVITDGKNGLLVGCDDEVAMTRALVRLRDDAALRENVAAAGRETARQYAAPRASAALSAWLRDLRAGKVRSGTVTESSTLA
jgi:glycosyltransferase involved in cell wall biosynthesis